MNDRSPVRGGPRASWWLAGLLLAACGPTGTRGPAVIGKDASASGGSGPSMSGGRAGAGAGGRGGSGGSVDAGADTGGNAGAGGAGGMATGTGGTGGAVTGGVGGGSMAGAGGGGAGGMSTGGQGGTAGRGGTGGGGGSGGQAGTAGSGGAGGTGGTGGQPGTGGRGGSGGQSGAGGRDAGALDAPIANTGNTIMGRVGRVNAVDWNRLSQAVLIANPENGAVTIVWLFENAVTCNELAMPDWGYRIGGIQHAGLYFSTSTGPHTVPGEGPGFGSVLYFGADAEDNDQATGGTITLSTLQPGSRAAGSFDVTFAGGRTLKGTFDAVFCANSYEP